MNQNDIKKPILKSITYRLLGSLTTVLISYSLGLSINWSLILGFTELLVKPTIYFFHELVWNKWLDKYFYRYDSDKIF
jgi:uncharacterized membrane protein